jgi:polyisoprenoid-binding protein YceI
VKTAKSFGLPIVHSTINVASGRERPTVPGLGRTSSERVAGLVGSARVVKAANTLGAAALGADPHEAGGQRVILVSGDDVDAKSTALKGEPVMSSTAVEIPGYVAGTYTIDPGHSDVAFTVRHLMVSKVRGHFTRFQGELALAPDPLASSVAATIELASIDTNNPQRDDDLRSANFFETDTYSTMTFRSTGIRHSEDGFDVDGELTLHGVTRPVTLALDVNGFTRDPYGGTRAGFSATTELNRSDFGISTNIPMDGGGVVIGDRIQVFIEIEAVLNPPPPTT